MSGVAVHCGVQSSQCYGFSYCGAQALGHVSFSSLGPRLNSHGTLAYLLLGLWDLPGQGLNLGLLHWLAFSLSLSCQGILVDL